MAAEVDVEAEQGVRPREPPPSRARSQHQPRRGGPLRAPGLEARHPVKRLLPVDAEVEVAAAVEVVAADRARAFRHGPGGTKLL